MWVVLVCGFLLQVVDGVGFNSVVMIIICLYGDGWGYGFAVSELLCF